MTTEKKQSDIAEVRDQLSLDFADGTYLNVISQNLGMDRPVLGYTDDSWRAIVKILALEYKQISNKFRDVLTILFGPQITEVGTLAEAVEVGDAECVLTDTSNLPQLGTLLFDEGLPSEESKNYCYIDRVTNTVFLETSFGAAHAARDADSEEPIVTISPLNEVVFLKTNNFPTTDYPYPVVLGRGTANEEVVQVTLNDTDHATLTLSGAPLNSHPGYTSSDVLDSLAQAYFFTSSFLLLEDSTQFPAEGTLKLAATDSFAVTAAGSGPTDRVVTLATGTFTVESLIGYEIVFDGNVTAALAGQVRKVVDNNDDTVTAEVTVDVDFSGPGTAPQIGDTFKVFPIVKYTSIDFDTHTVTLRKPILQDLTIPLASTVELLVDGETAALSPVKFAGAGWDVIQSNPRVVELLLPAEIRDPNDIRSASYMHDDSLGAISTTNSVGVSPGDTVVTAVTFASFPDAGTLEFDPGGGSAERVAYGKAISSLVEFAAEGAGELLFEKTTSFPATGSIILHPGTSIEETLAYSANDTALGKLTLTGTTTFNHQVGEVAKCTTQLNLQSGAVNTHGIGTTVAFYQPLYTSVPIGDFNQATNTFPGPYVYSLTEPAATATVAVTAASSIIPGTTKLAIGQSPGRNALEVEDGISALEGLGSTFSITIGSGTASKEDLAVSAVALKSRAITTLATTNPLAGDTTIEVASLTPNPAIDGGQFPNSNGYRIVIDEGTSSREVAYVIAASALTNATASIDGGANGTVNITAVGNLAGLAGNAATVEVTVPAGTSPLTVVLSGASNEIIEVQLDVIGGVATATGENEGGKIAAAIDALADFSATATGTGLTEIGVASGPDSFTGGTEGFTLEDPLTLGHSIGESVSLMADIFSAPLITKSHAGLVSLADRSTAIAPVSEDAYFVKEDPEVAEFVSPLVDSITLDSVTGLDVNGGRVVLNFGNGQVPVYSTLSAPVSAGAPSAALVSSDDFPSPTSSFIIVLGEGTPTEERILVSANNTGTDVLTFDGYLCQYAHATGDVVSWYPGSTEAVEYAEIVGNDLRFSPEIVLQYSHYPAESVIDSSVDSDPRTNGYDFPLRMPVDIVVRLQYLLDIVRAAGVQVELITQR